MQYIKDNSGCKNQKNNNKIYNYHNPNSRKNQECHNMPEQESSFNSSSIHKNLNNHHQFSSSTNQDNNTNIILETLCQEFYEEVVRVNQTGRNQWLEELWRLYPRIYQESVGAKQVPLSNIVRAAYSKYIQNLAWIDFLDDEKKIQVVNSMIINLNGQMCVKKPSLY